ncbi:hypothetical protein [Paenibacillus tyrfis]|uniref:Uncharacterized protein n=1 Tax=Paenibacillus tyrfis TaxID=1501230 RepID=A0A081P4K1_9BACL|nr:hypothetical protein [Paenibacillus tyrfis]KEQ25624.1 hypothetical protein ET33_02585 [Paenibacillus tyrfis]
MNLAQPKASIVFNKLLVNAIENNSGIFIGTNQAFGWSHYTKSNQIFGSVKDSCISHMVNALYDPDVIDSSVEDVKCVDLAVNDSLQPQCDISLHSIHAVSLNNQSVIAVGENEQNGWSGVHKNNYGTGKCYGLNRIQQVSNTILDNDYIDSPARIETNVAETLVG